VVSHAGIRQYHHLYGQRGDRREHRACQCALPAAHARRRIALDSPVGQRLVQRSDHGRVKEKSGAMAGRDHRHRRPGMAVGMSYPIRVKRGESRLGSGVAVETEEQIRMGCVGDIDARLHVVNAIDRTVAARA